MRSKPDPSSPAARPKRADARLNEQTLLDAASSLFVTAGVNVPIREIASRAGVGTATIYRHFPTRADLVGAVYQHQVDACVRAGPELLAGSSSPLAALEQWMDLFVDFLVTKHGLAAAMRSGKSGFAAMQDSFLERLMPVCAEIIAAAASSGELRQEIGAFELMYAAGNLCIGEGTDPRYDARRLVRLLIAGLRRIPG